MYVAGDSSMHLRSVLKDTAVFSALRRVLERGGLVVAIGPSAAALCDPMFDVRGGAFTLGLGLITGVAIIPESETWSDEALARTRALATTPVIVLPTGSAAVSHGDGWELVGEAEANGDLPAPGLAPLLAGRRRGRCRRRGGPAAADGGVDAAAAGAVVESTTAAVGRRGRRSSSSSHSSSPPEIRASTTAITRTTATAAPMRDAPGASSTAAAPAWPALLDVV